MRKFFSTRNFLLMLLGIMLNFYLLVVHSANSPAPSPTPAAATPQTIGLVVWVKGVVKASQPNVAERVLSRRSPIYEKDTLKTDPQSTGEVAFSDNSLVALRENTSMQIAQYKFSNGANPSQDTYVANLTKGGFRTITGAIPKNHPQGYKSNTPVATIGVLGTEYSVFYTPGQGKSGLVTKLDKGSIEVSNAAGKVILKKCTSLESKAGCHDQLYSQTTSANKSPNIVNQKPVEFANDVQVTPAGGILTPPGSGGSGPGGSSNGGGGTGVKSGVVSSFCIH